MRNILFFGLLFLVCCIGCGKGGYRVTGKVTYPDGKPVTRGQVVLNSPSFTGGGDIIADGTYAISAVGGVPAGSYKVSVIAVSESKVDPTVSVGAAPPSKPLVDPKYNNPKTSGLTCEVSGITQYDIEVTAPK